MKKEKEETTAKRIFLALAAEWLAPLAEKMAPLGARLLDSPANRAVQAQQEHAAEQEELVQSSGALGWVPFTRPPQH